LGYSVDNPYNRRCNSHELYELSTCVKLLTTESNIILIKFMGGLRMKKILLLLILIAVVVSGCVGQDGGNGQQLACPGAGSTDGIVITDFSFDYSPVYAGESPGLNLEVQNNGGEIGTLLGVDIFGPEIVDKATDLQWGGQTKELSKKINEELDPPDSTMNMPGGVWSNVWTLTAPTKLATDTDYTFNARARYNYETTFTAVLTVMKSTYLRSLPAEKRQELINSGGLSQQCYSGGPLKVTGAAGTHFIDPEGEKTIRFKIENVGSGYTYCDTDPKKSGCVDNIDPGNTMYHVKIRDPLSGGNYFTKGCAQDVILSKGQSVVFSCKFTAPKFTNKQDITFSIPIEYNYYVDAAAPIKVQRALK